MRADVMILWFEDVSATFDLPFCQVYKWLSTHFAHLRNKLIDQRDKEMTERKEELKHSAKPKSRKSKKKSKKKKPKKHKKKKHKTRRDEASSESDSSSDSSSSSGERGDSSDNPADDVKTSGKTKAPKLIKPTQGRASQKRKAPPKAAPAPKIRAPARKRKAPANKMVGESEEDEVEEVAENYGPPLVKGEVGSPSSRNYTREHTNEITHANNNTYMFCVCSCW